VDWARDYRGKAAVVYCHTPVPGANWLNNTLNIDTGCVFGGALTAVRWPEREVVSVAAKRVLRRVDSPDLDVARSRFQRPTMSRFSGCDGKTLV
jgi:protein phosphatase